MPSIQIKNVSSEAHAVLTRRAAEAHQSLQEYLRTSLERDAAQPTLDEVLARIRTRTGGSAVATDDVVEFLRADRDSH